MRKRGFKFKAVVPALCVMFLVSACSAAPSGPSEKPLSVPAPAHSSKLKSMSVIPSYNGPKYRTTNRQGTTYSGMGTSTYSHIGSSGLHDGGQTESGRLEAILHNEGIQGIKVLMLGDKVVIGEKRGGVSGIDPLQSKLLSPYAGSSGRSNSHTSGSTAVPSDKSQARGLEQAKHRIQALLGGQIRVLTVTHPDALAAMERVKHHGDVSINSSNKEQSKDMALILKHAQHSK